MKKLSELTVGDLITIQTNMINLKTGKFASSEKSIIKIEDKIIVTEDNSKYCQITGKNLVDLESLVGIQDFIICKNEFYETDNFIICKSE